VPEAGHNVSFRGSDDRAVARELLPVNAPCFAQLPGQQILRVEFLKGKSFGLGHGSAGGEHLREALVEVRGKLLDNFGFTRARKVELRQTRADGGRPIRHIPLP